MDGHIQTASLLPYLCDNGGKICLDISTIRTGPEQPGRRVESFIPEYTGDFLAVGFNAQIRMDSGSTVRQVMLLAQRDQYPFFSDHSPKFTNSIIDKCWRQAAGQNEVNGFVSDQILFAEQFTDCGELLPFAPLFFCNKRELFFHPPCLRCGKLLLLCRDDELLGEFGLAHYSRSLRRYLYCPSCTPLHGGPWYTRTMNGEEKSVVKDCSQLIQDFGSITSAADPDTCFPCSECLHREDCYGTAVNVFDVINVFLFYPFYMTLRQRVSCSGHDYLAMVSGASPGQLTDYWRERGVSPSNMNNGGQPEYPEEKGFLYPVEDSRHFLEVLYLKMQFLRLVATDLVNNSLIKRFSDHYIPTSTIGVSLLSNTSFPSFWSFSLSYTGLGEFFPEVTPYPKKTNPNHGYTIGLLWFVVLLSNKQQGEVEIFEQLNSLLENGHDKTVALRKLDDTFQPYQLYWSSGHGDGDTDRWTVQWDNLLAAGRDLLVAGYHNENGQQPDVLETIDIWLADLKGYILPPMQLKASQMESGHVYDSDSIEIFNIIEKVKEKWELTENQSRVDTATVQTGFEEFVYPDKTVIIPSGSGIARATAAAINVSAVDDGNAFEETVIISTRENRRNITAPSGDEDLEDTVQMSANSGAGAIDNEEKQEFPENIVGNNPQQYDDEEDFLTETVVLSSIKKDG